MFVSVVIPSFNRPESTLRAVRSALGQTFPVAEVIVVDDASEPALDQEALRALDPRVDVHRLSRNSGASAARQYGIDHARGEVLAFLDSDDVWDAGKLEAQMPALLSAGSEPVAVSCGWRERKQNGLIARSRIPVEAARPIDFASGCWFCPGSTVILLRASFELVGPLDLRLRRLEDFDWFARFGLVGGRLLVVPQVATEIAVGRRARSASVEPAAATILDKPIWKRELRSDEHRALRAWIEVERVRALLNDGRRARAAMHLVRSFALVPRRSIQLRDWWARADRQDVLV